MSYSIVQNLWIPTFMLCKSANPGWVDVPAVNSMHKTSSDDGNKKRIGPSRILKNRNVSAFSAVGQLMSWDTLGWTSWGVLTTYASINILGNPHHCRLGLWKPSPRWPWIRLTQWVGFVDGVICFVTPQRTRNIVYDYHQLVNLGSILCWNVVWLYMLSHCNTQLKAASADTPPKIFPSAILISRNAASTVLSQPSIQS